jgi:dienelactone hydrolase
MLRSTFLASLLALLTAVSADAAVQTKEITYKHGDLECKGFLAWDDAVEGKRPGVLVVHEWWGLNDYARNRAKQLAEDGYIAFAADMYGEGKHTDHPAEAKDFATKVRSNVDDWVARAKAALEVLKAQPQCDTSKLAAMGYCFGGSTALQLAYSGADIKCVATFHAALPVPSEQQAKQTHASILVCHGAEDSFIPPATIAEFQKALDKAGVDWEMDYYAGTVHSFTVPGVDEKKLPGMAYNKKADERSWHRMQDFFAEHLGLEPHK